jgi:uncharacterized protein (TIGR02594 family)
MRITVIRTFLAVSSIAALVAATPALARDGHHGKRNASKHRTTHVSSVYAVRKAHRSRYRWSTHAARPTRAGAQGERVTSIHTPSRNDVTGEGHPSGSAGSGDSSGLIAEARRWIGTNPTGRSSLWCARFMNFVLKRTGHRGTGSDLARSFASYGQRIAGPQVGAIAVISRGRGGGHVGIVTGTDASGNPVIVSGNHSHRVAEGVYPRSRVIAYVKPI